MEIKIATEQDREAVFALRVEVFVREQNVPPEIELDQEDAHALHFIAKEDGIAVGCARVIRDGDDAHIGRLAVKKSHRGRGIGRDICRFIIEDCKGKGCTRVWLNSQLHAVGFYQKLGFLPTGSPFFEAGIEHVTMELSLPIEYPPIHLTLEDEEWPLEYINHERQIVRAIVFDDAGKLYFVRLWRDDMFGTGTFIETAGGGVEPGETLSEALARELDEELGIKADTVCKLGVVRDAYNLIHRHNVNHYFLCKVKSFGTPHQTKEELHNFRLLTLKTDPQAAIAEYERCREHKLGRILANRELPILRHAMKILCDFIKEEEPHA